MPDKEYFAEMQGRLLIPDEEPEYQREKALIKAIGDFAKIENEGTKEYLEDMIRKHPAPIKIFHDINRTYCDNSTYEKLRLNALFKLIYLLARRQNEDYKNLDAGKTVRLSNISKLLNFVFHSYDMITVENALLLILNDRFVCRKVHVGSGGMSDSCYFPSELIGEALSYSRGSQIILVHSHLGGVVSPSVADIDMTAKLAEVVRGYQCTLFEHFVVSMKNGEYIYDSILRSREMYEKNGFVALHKMIWGDVEP